MSGTIAPFATITDTDKSPVILVCATIGFVLTLLITGIRVWITARGKLGFKHDDFLAFGSLVRTRRASCSEHVALTLSRSLPSVRA
jgi:hypothetical protein